ncbi:hypothetical protein T4C_8563 [Trichinella pseudospiralis]|uniref:Uncharacterized protein n=1 Tax=Trichinella pseudospiralis TaxID=6337 RepID=A0A0V1GXC7_TRIPS|nr:hypothetical protein T4C_8563 [Trichinella pseudospiralis]
MGSNRLIPIMSGFEEKPKIKLLLWNKSRPNFALSMLIHFKVVSYLKISRGVFNQGGRKYAHCTWQIVPNRLIPIMSTLVKITFSRKFRIFLRLARFAKNGENLVLKF